MALKHAIIGPNRVDVYKTIRILYRVRKGGFVLDTDIDITGLLNSTMYLG